MKKSIHSHSYKMEEEEEEERACFPFLHFWSRNTIRQNGWSYMAIWLLTLMQELFFFFDIKTRLAYNSFVMVHAYMIYDALANGKQPLWYQYHVLVYIIINITTKSSIDFLIVGGLSLSLSLIAGMQIITHYFRNVTFSLFEKAKVIVVVYLKQNS